MPISQPTVCFTQKANRLFKPPHQGFHLVARIAMATSTKATSDTIRIIRFELEGRHANRSEEGLTDVIEAHKLSVTLR